MFVIMVFFISLFMVSNGLTPKVMVCVTGISSGIDCEGTQGFVFPFRLPAHMEQDVFQC